MTKIHTNDTNPKNSPQVPTNSTKTGTNPEKCINLCNPVNLHKSTKILHKFPQKSAKKHTNLHKLQKSTKMTQIYTKSKILYNFPKLYKILLKL